jgi:hypothetical protein
MKKATKPSIERSGHFSIRIPKRLRDRIAQVAEERGSSTDDVIARALEAAIDHVLPKQEAADVMNRLAIRLHMLELRVSAIDGAKLEGGGGKAGP